MARTVWGDPQRYADTYWGEFADFGWYFTGDSARKDEDGYFWIIGRMDDVIKVSGYRLGTAEIESALVSHSTVAEAACVGVPDELKGNVIHAFCILNAGQDGSDDLVAELKNHVRHEVGPIAVPAVIEFVPSLPKTRSGKIMRRLLKAQVLGQPVGDTSTLES
jgi:acetyl-CoA synthetase